MKTNASRFDRLPVIDAESVGRPRLRLENPVLADGGEVVDWSYYDFASCALDTPFTPAQILFQVGVGGPYTPVGGTTFAKTFLHTNVEGSGGLLPNGYKLDTQAIRFVIDQAVQYEDLDNLLYMTFLNFIIGAKPYFQGPAANLPGGVGGVLSSSPTTNGPANSNGWQGNLRGVYSFSASLEASIAYGQNFRFIIDGTQGEDGTWSTQSADATPAGKGFRSWIHLDGINTRPTQ